MTTMEQRAVPLTCHGHSRPVTHLNFSPVVDHDQFYLISGCKDGNPMLRDGLTGDWIGTFIGHKGAVWQGRISHCATMAATASADFSAKVWDCHTGECICTLQHAHIVRAVAFPPIHKPLLIATGGFEKKLRIYDISQYEKGAAASSISKSATNGVSNGTNGYNNTSSGSPTSPVSLDGVTKAVTDPGSFEVGEGVHKGTIKSIIWLAKDILVTAADDNKIRWFDIRSRSLLAEFELAGTIGSCEIDSEGAIISVAAGKTAYFFSGSTPGELVRSVDTPHDLGSVALHKDKRQFVVGGTSDTWVRVYNYDNGKELDVQRGHHGPIWTVGITPDGKMYGTGSEDGTIKLWKFTPEPYGLWR